MKKHLLISLVAVSVINNLSAKESFIESSHSLKPLQNSELRVYEDEEIATVADGEEDSFYSDSEEESYTEEILEDIDREDIAEEDVEELLEYLEYSDLADEDIDNAIENYKEYLYYLDDYDNFDEDISFDDYSLYDNFDEFDGLDDDELDYLEEPYEKEPQAHKVYKLNDNNCTDSKNTKLYLAQNASYQKRDDGGFDKTLITQSGDTLTFQSPSSEKNMEIKIANSVESSFLPPACSDLKFNDDGSFVNKYDKDDISLKTLYKNDGEFQFTYQTKESNETAIKFQAPKGSNSKIDNSGKFYNYMELNNITKTEFKSSINGESILTIKAKDKEAIEINAPKNIGVKIDINGTVEQSLNRSDKRVDVIANQNGDIRAKLDKKDKDRYFDAIDGSQIDISSSGDVSSSKSQSVDDLNVTTTINIEDSNLSAVITLKNLNSRSVDKEANIYISYSMSPLFLNGGIDIVASWFDNSKTRDKNDLDKGYLNIDFLAQDRFIYPYEALKTNNTYLEITPNTRSAFNHKMFFNKNQSLNLVSGDVNITGSINGVNIELNNIASISIERDDYIFITPNSILTVDENSNILMLLEDEYFYSLPVNAKDIEIEQDGNFTFLYSLDENIYFDEEHYLETTDSKIEEKIYKDSKEVTILSGEAILNSKALKVNEKITLNNLSINKSSNLADKIEIAKGWNLISNPISKLIKLNSSNYQIFTYQNSNWQNEVEYLAPLYGYWIYSNENSQIDINGSSYDFNISTFEKNRWFLLGASTDISLDSNSSLSFSYKNQNWIKNPNKINKGEGFWLKNY